MVESNYVSCNMQKMAGCNNMVGVQYIEPLRIIRVQLKFNMKITAR
jgi:hypothetical protein